MTIRTQIILSQLNPPAQRSHVLVRERVNRLLLGTLAHQVTILQAGTGYGKTTAILSFIKNSPVQVFWYTVSPTDRDTTVFLANLFTAFTQGEFKIGLEALRIFDLEGTSNLDALIALINAMAKDLKEESLIVLDDFHHVRDVPEIVRLVDWMVEHLPGHVHLLLSTRRSLDFPSLNKWKVQNTLLKFEDRDLAFDLQEIADLFASEYTYPLNPIQTRLLSEKTEGWAIGLQMVWQSLRNNPELRFEKILQDDRESRKSLFAFLAEEVLGRLDASLQHFLLTTAILTEMDSASCEFLLDQPDSLNVLQSLVATGLFVDELRPGVYRYHHMFREFLLSRLDSNLAQVNQLHRKIASYFTAHQFWEMAIYHMLKAGDFQNVNLILEGVGDKLIKEGRQESLAIWISDIPENIRSGLPYIQYLSGEIYRYMARFEQALDHYHAAEQLYEVEGNKIGCSLAIQGQAQIYLDTIRPANAVQPLTDALNLLDPQESPAEVARLMVLLAENQLNLGDPESAEVYLAKARELDTEIEADIDYITARVLLRTGRIDEGIRLLQKTDLDLANSELTRPQRFHREGTVLLSLFYAFKGDLDLSEVHALRGIEIGKNLGSSFVQSVGLMRLGHPTQLNELLNWRGEGYLQAIGMYEESIQKVDVERIHVEPLWGICRALGFSGRIIEAREQAKNALEIAARSGDEWIAILIHISYGASELMAGNFHESQSILTVAESMAIKVKDPFTLCAARIWLAVNAWQQGYKNSAIVYMKKLFPMIQKHHYEYLLTRVTLLGFSQPAMMIPLLIDARKHDLHTDLVNSLLADLKALAVAYHPGYDLRIQTLGGFSVWRGDKLIERKTWKREKARQLLQILVSNKNKWLTRDQIITILWPEADSETGANNFKVALNMLNQVLEPSRPSQEQPFFVVRRHDKYGVNPNTQILIDAEIFEQIATSVDRTKYAQAVHLYQGQFLENETMQEWFMSEVQFFHQHYIHVMEHLSAEAIKDNDLDLAITYLEQLIAKDQLYEPAYRSLMKIYYQMGNLGMLQQVYQQCQQVMERQLNSTISEDLQMLYQQMLNRENSANH